MIVCPACRYPNDEQDHRCERCGRRFDAPPLGFEGDDEVFFESGVEEMPAADDLPSSRVEDDLPPWAAEPELNRSLPHSADSASCPAGCARGSEESELESPLEARPAPRPAPATPQWKGEISDRIRRFRERHSRQRSLFDEEQDPAATEAAPRQTLGQSGDRGKPAQSLLPTQSARGGEGDPSAAARGKVIPFEQIAARAAAAAAKSAPVAIDRPLSSAQPQRATEVSETGPAATRSAEARNAEGAGAADLRRMGLQPGAESGPPAAPPRPWPDAPPRAPATPKAPPRRRRRSLANRADAFVAPFLNFPEPPPDPRTVPIDTPVDVEVAPIRARALAAAYDAAVIAAGAILFFAAYTAVGGRFPFQRACLAAFGVSAALIAFVFALFCLCFSDSTPGLRWLGIRLVDFDGKPAPRDQRIMRLLGMTMSALALGLGFLWSIADEDGLTWHDRMSRTCLTMTGSAFVRRPRG